MIFTYSVIGDNTPENREHLEKLGYEVHPKSGSYLFTYRKGLAVAMRSSFMLCVTNIQNNQYINCISNSALFQAVTAMRSDNDYMQWFYIESLFCRKSFYLCEENIFNANEDYLPYEIFDFHKASLSELQEHFK